jgi:predicted RNA-binding Zn-ribbon protein involved in translation (DUF1610 family)
MGSLGEPITVRGKPLICPHCGNGRFERREAHLNTPLMTFLGMDWLNRTAEVFVCTACGRIEWFLDPCVEVADDTTEPTQCVSCGNVIPAGQDKCLQCGWTYKE